MNISTYPVTVETAQTGRYLTVTRTAQAASLLLNKWPYEKRGSPKYRSAIKAVMDVMEQRKTVSVARKAFTVAPKDADLFVREGPLATPSALMRLRKIGPQATPDRMSE